MKKRCSSILLSFLGIATMAQQSPSPIWSSPAYSVYADRITQGKYTARALSATEMTSDYQSPANLFKSSLLSFKFSINGKDNEMKSGIDHLFNITPQAGTCVTPLIRFGTQIKPAATDKETFLPPDTKLTIRLDMREVLASFKSKGYYLTFNGDKIYKEDFKGVFVAGSAAPLTWDFDNLVHHQELQLHDTDGDGIYETTFTMNAQEQQNQTAAQWKLSKDISAFPQYRSAYPLTDALYNLALEEMMRAVEADSTFRTGKEWAGVWTRDVSYSIILSMAYLQPQVARYSLLRKVNKKKKIIQDTGTGGAWPVSSDRMIWAVAAWEIYKATGDKDWLKEAFTIIKNSINDDVQNIYDPEIGLVKGESSFLDWREQTYPRWMQPADIFESGNLGTNAVHYQANKVLADMAVILNQPELAARHREIANTIKTAINKYLWQPTQQYYGQYLYGRAHKILSPRSEALGEALCILFGVADEAQQKQIISRSPVTTYGVPCIWPDIPGIPPYHNNAVWPFVQSFWLWAAVQAGNEKAVTESISAIYRPAALFLTNKENFVAENGDYTGTQINSSNMLWSLSGSISIVHKVLFGISFEENSLLFKPFVPEQWRGKRSLTDFKYRDAVLNIDLEGYGNEVKSFLLDGKPMDKPEIPASLKGIHHISIVLTSARMPKQSINKVASYTSPAAPLVTMKNNILIWQKVPGAVEYKILCNGKPLKGTTAVSFTVIPKEAVEYQVMAVDKQGITSFASEPVQVVKDRFIKTYQAEMFAPAAAYPYKGFTGNGFIEIATDKNTSLEIPVTISEAGQYLLDSRYANGNGPTNTENKCAIRTILIDGKPIGVWVFPQRGKEEWSNWGFTNTIRLHLPAGKHTITLRYEPANENMNEIINQAMIDYVRVTKAG